MSKTIHTIGPLVPLSNKTNLIAREAPQSEKHAEIETFMDRILKSHGKQSLLYISFGSIFWSKKPQTIWTFLDAVMDIKIPFILSHASPFATIPNDVATKVEQYGLGILSPWSPQQTILAHSATGWFLTHCGQNSTLEAITLGVPLICWPYHGDQVTNAAHLTMNLDVAYELFEVRTGNGLKAIHRTGKAPVGTLESIRVEAMDVLGKAFGEDGKKKRANMIDLQKKILSSWSSGGASEIEMRELVDLASID